MKPKQFHSKYFITHLGEKVISKEIKRETPNIEIKDINILQPELDKVTIIRDNTYPEKAHTFSFFAFGGLINHI